MDYNPAEGGWLTSGSATDFVCSEDTTSMFDGGLSFSNWISAL
jgi:hypothetical protein